MLLLLLESALLLAGVSGVNQTAQMEVLQHYSNNFEGRFCFPLDHDIVGWELVIEFNPGVSNIQQWEGDFIHNTGTGSGCQTHVEMVNKNYQGKHGSGTDLCVKLSGQVCGGGEPAATATFVDVSGDCGTPPTAPRVSGAQSMKYNYAEVLQKSILFYEAQRSGKLPADNRVCWRGDSGLQDRGSGGEDLTGGWYDAGDNVKFNFPMAWSTTTLCWSLLEFPEAYRAAGQLDHVYSQIRWTLEYLVKCHTKPNELYVQVGDGGTDHGSWTSPERMDPDRPAFKIDASNPGSDVAGETAAAMACGAMAFKTKDAAFAATLTTHAKQLYAFGKAHQGFYSQSVNEAAAYYQSNNYTDELTWSALWLNKLTGDQQYLDDAKRTYIGGVAWGFSWDEKIGGNEILLYEATQDDRYKADIEATMRDWSPAGTMTYTPKCLAWRLQWGALRYSANTAFLALLAAKQGLHADEYNQWAMCQIHYALGDAGRSFVCGFGTNPPQKPHHRAASCPLIPAPCSWDSQQSSGPNPHVLYGALVGGPGNTDDYTDDRLDYVHNEVACDYNAGLQGSAAALLQLALNNKLPAATSCGSC